MESAQPRTPTYKSFKNISAFKYTSRGRETVVIPRGALLAIAGPVGSTGMVPVEWAERVVHISADDLNAKAHPV